MAKEGEIINVFGEMPDEEFVGIGGGAGAVVKVGDEEVGLVAESVKEGDGIEAAGNTEDNFLVA